MFLKVMSAKFMLPRLIIAMLLLVSPRLQAGTPLYSRAQHEVCNDTLLSVTHPSDTIKADTLLIELEETVVTAFNRTQKLLEVPGSITSLGRTLIERDKPAFNILPLLDHAPGVFAHQGATNTNRVTIRGIGARVPYATGKIRGYFNNIPLTNTSGVTFIQDIDPAVIQSMEVIKGPATSVYGAGLGGTIAIRARQPQARQNGISNTFRAGAFGLLRNSVTADLSGSNAATSLVYSHTQSDGYRENNQFQRDAITSVSQLLPGDDTHLTLLLAYVNLKSHIPSSIDSLTYMDSPRSAAENWLKTEGYEDSQRLLGGITASRQFRETLSADISLFGIWHDEKEMRPFDVFYEERHTAGSRFNVRRHHNAAKAEFEFSGGGELFFEDYRYSNHENIGGEGIQGGQLSDNREKVITVNLFVQADAGLGQWNLSSGVNLNYSTIDYRDRFHTGQQNRSGRYNYGVIFSPRVSAAYKYHSNHTAFATISHGFSPPSLSETLTPGGEINPDILPEKSWNLEMGLRGQTEDHRLYYDFSLYHMQVRDLLVAERVGEDAWVGKNAGESLHRGLEAELQWIILDYRRNNDQLPEKLSLRANYAYKHFYFTDFTDMDEDYSGNRLPGVPRQVFYASLHNEWSAGLYATAGWRFVGPMAMNDANSRFTSSYGLLDLSLGYQRDISPQWEADLYIRANNLLDRHYPSMILVNAPSFGGPPRYYYPGLPMHFNMGISISFKETTRSF